MERISPGQFHQIDWRVIRHAACAHFRTGSFAAGTALVDAIARLADEANHDPDVDLRSDGVTVQMDAPRPQRNRIHIDVYVPHDQAEARVAAALAAGGHIASDENAPEWWTLADAEGNEVDVAPWPDRDEGP